MLMFYKWAFICSFILNLILYLTSRPLSPSLPLSSNSLSPFQFSTYFYLLTSFFRPLHVSLLFYIPWSLAFSHFLSLSPAISMISFIFTMLCFHFLSLPFFLLLLLSSPTHLLCASLCVSGDSAASAGGQLSAGGRAPGRGVVQGPAAVWRPSVRHALDPLSHRHAVWVRLLGRLQTEPSHHHLQVRAPPTVLDDQIASAAVLIYWLLMWIWLVIAEWSHCGVSLLTVRPSCRIVSCRVDELTCSPGFLHNSRDSLSTGYPTELTAQGLWCTMVQYFTTKSAHET